MSTKFQRLVRICHVEQVLCLSCWPRRMLPAVSYGEYAEGTVRQTKRQILPDLYIMRSAMDAASLKTSHSSVADIDHLYII